MDASLKTPSQLVLKRAEAGQSVQVELTEWGEFGKHGQRVELVADGQVDQFVTELAAKSPGQELLSLDDRRLARFAAQAIGTARRIDVNPKTSGDYLSALEWRRWDLKKALANVELKGTISGVVDEADGFRVEALLFPNTEASGHFQSVSVSHSSTGSRVELYTTPRNSKTHHVMQAPMREDLSLDLSRLEERLEVIPSWFRAEYVQGMPEECIRTVTDPRLRQLTESADRAQTLPPDALGAGWSCQESEGIQRFERREQVIELDTRNSQVLLMHFKDGKPLWPAPGILYENGKFREVPNYALEPKNRARSQSSALQA